MIIAIYKCHVRLDSKNKGHLQTIFLPRLPSFFINTEPSILLAIISLPSDAEKLRSIIFDRQGLNNMGFQNK